MNIVSRGKNLYHFISSTIELIHKNIFLFGRLVLLSVSSLVGGIAATPLLSFFNEGKRPVEWYIEHIVPLGGLLVCVLFILYLIIHIIEKQTHSEVKRVKAEHVVRTKETEEKEYFHYREQRPRTEKLVAYAKEKLLCLPWKKNE